MWKRVIAQDTECDFMYVNIHGNTLEIYAHVVKSGTTSGRLMDCFLSFKKIYFFFTSSTMHRVLVCIQKYCASSSMAWLIQSKAEKTPCIWLRLCFSTKLERKKWSSHRSEDRNHFLYASTCLFLKGLEMRKLEILPQSDMEDVKHRFSLTETCWSKKENEPSLVLLVSTSV